ncbi:MAG: hypothetical protein R2911_14520 [Caldilineaceae bacterium]
MNPLPIPPDFNPQTNMLAKTTEYGAFHESRRAARFGADLVANGTPEDLALAQKVLAAALACQERNPADPHVGNFYWMREDSEVEDLNAVEFVLEALIPMLLRHGERLPPALHAQVLASVRLGLAEIARLDVLVAYTNITALDIVNTCLGGQLLADAAIAQRGRQKLRDWLAFTNLSGHPLEYSSPTYTSVSLRALKRLVDHSDDEAVLHLAAKMTARLAVSMALHIHGDGAGRGTGRWAGPHSRAYQPSVVCKTAPEVNLLRGWVADGAVPAWVGELFDNLPQRFQVVETADRQRGLSFTTFQTPAYALGVASRSFGGQSNVCMAHYRRHPVHNESDARPGVFYTRYVLNEKWFGDAYHATDRTKTRNLPDEGDFLGVQHENRAICVYAPPLSLHCHSAKTALIWTQLAHIDEIWVEDVRVTQLPAPVPTLDATVVIGSGEVYMAVRPLALTPLSKETPMQLVERDGDLVLELFNYRGPDKRFWEMRWPGAFYQGRPVCAYYLEIGERADYADGAAFGQQVAQTHFAVNIAAPFTYPASGQRPATFVAARDGAQLGIEIDLMEWNTLRRWTAQGELGWPKLDSPVARQYEDGRLEIDLTEALVIQTSPDV